MKKLYIFIVFLFVYAGNIKSQTVWSPSGATWHYSYNSFWATGYAVIEYSYDQVVQGKNCKALINTLYSYDNVLMTHDTTVVDTIYTYASNDSVFYLDDDNQFYLMCNFDAVVNDVWVSAEPDPNCVAEPTTTVKVDNINTTVINGFTLRQVDVSTEATSHKGYSGPIYERLGPVDFITARYKACLADADPIGGLRCYYDDVFGSAQLDTLGCEYFTGITNPSEKEFGFSIYPNPASEFCTIGLSQMLVKPTLEILDVSGKTVAEKKFITGMNTTVNVSALSKGSYIFKITTANGQQCISKFIKE